MTPTIWSLPAIDRSSVCTSRACPAVVTWGDAAPSTPAEPTASRSLSAFSWVICSEERLTVYWVPPVNSMPKLSPLTSTTAIARPTRSSETLYQSVRRPMKSIDRVPP